MNQAETNNRPRAIELLAPARDASTAMAALQAGADAIYMGGPMLGARKDAANGVAELAQVAREVHRYGARLYVTLNTIIYDHELEAARKLTWQLWHAGVDALIVQDMALLKMSLSPIELHASTQCDTRTPAKARFLAQAGFAQVVVARELSLEELTDVCQAVEAEGARVEAFVHGALCVCYSGDCRASLALTGRSANRGECAQICRLPFDLEDANGRKLLTGKHLLSLRDMNRQSSVEEMLQAGVSSLKIEGRLKDANYVKNVVAAYRRQLDAIIAAHPELYCRASAGSTTLGFTPDVRRSFNRGFTDYFLRSEPLKGSLANFRSPKWAGQEIGTVTGCRQLLNGGTVLTAELHTELHNGDGLGYYDFQGQLQGFRLNRVEAKDPRQARLYPAERMEITPGTRLLRNFDKAFADMVATPQAAQRRIAVEMQLHLTPNLSALVLTLTDETGLWVSVVDNYTPQTAKSPQEEPRRRVLTKLGDTIYEAAEKAIHDEVGALFVPASQLAALRRRAVAMLEAARQARRPLLLRRQPVAGLSLPEELRTLTYRNNVANRMAREFYTSLGAAILSEAAEVTPPSGRQLLMETRYCLRRELGQCLRNPAAKPSATNVILPAGPLFLATPTRRLPLTFDCSRCRMQLWND